MAGTRTGDRRADFRARPLKSGAPPDIDGTFRKAARPDGARLSTASPIDPPPNGRPREPAGPWIVGSPDSLSHSRVFQAFPAGRTAPARSP
jgi:hypothetical protein